MWNIFRHKTHPPQKVISGRFEIDQDGEVAYLEYSLTGNILELIHTEVPERLRRKGLGARLAETGLQFARDRKLKVDVVCPLVQRYVDGHAEYADLLLK